jgi:hypothetical protein
MCAFFVHGMIDLDVAFRLFVQISQLSAKLDDGSSVEVQRKCFEWVVDYHCYTMEKLEKDLAARVNWGSCQHPVISEFDMSNAGERKLVDDASLSLVFFERLSEKKLFLFVDVEDKPREVIANLAITEVVLSSVVSENASTHLIAEPRNVAHVIDWDNLEILPIAEDQIGVALPLMDEDEMYAFVGLAVEDERAEQERQATKNEKEGDDTTATVPMDLQGAYFTS